MQFNLKNSISVSIPSTPPLVRSSMVYREPDRTEHDTRRRREPWMITAALRRIGLFALILLSTWWASASFHYVLVQNHMTTWHDLIMVLFAFLFGWLAANFWTSVCGFFVLMKGNDYWNINHQADRYRGPLQAKTCIVMPTYNEDAALAFANIRAVYQSLAQTGELENFDFFILSDTSRPGQWETEERAWRELCTELNEFHHIFYRHRKNRIQKKSGNIADFCRRWGRHYKYMVVLDADSFISGALAVKMVKAMESRPDIGILQTAPKAINQNSLLARIQQFANHVYGPLFVTGLYFWQLGDSGFWGHNAVIRMEPFMKYCALPKLPGRPPFGGEILSHDFVEAALMRRAGFGVWLAYDWEGSFEQLPSSLLAELRRDRRWCQGNIQHLRFLTWKGISFGHRIFFLVGNCYYFSSLFWFLFLLVSTVSLLTQKFQVPDYFPVAHIPFPDWPVFHRAASANLLLITIIFLLMPKCLAILALTWHRQSKKFGGFTKIILSALLETCFSILFAPLRMLSHSQYIFRTLLGQKIEWNVFAEQRTHFRQALQAHAAGTMVAIAWGMAVFFINRDFFGWFCIFLVPLALSIPLSMASSHTGIGIACKKAGLFIIPEELNSKSRIRQI
jgi:membrane glycosyltransferase